MSAPTIYCYHCICSHLVIATTRSLSSLPRRRAPGLDKAIIVPLPPPPRAAEDESESENEDDDDVERMEIDNRPIAPKTGRSSKSVVDADEDNNRDQDYTLLLSSVRDRRACIIRRDDGFEKRLLWRCGRCRLIFGYQIDDDQLEDREKEEAQGVKRKGEKMRKNGYVYVLPGGVTSGEDMGTLGENEVAIGKED